MKLFKFKVTIFFFFSLFTFPLMGQNYVGDKEDIDVILKNIKEFSEYYVNADYSKLAECYTVDGKIFPDKTDIIEGREAIEKRWTLPSGVSVLEHKVTPSEIHIENKIAYDYGYYEGKTKQADGNISSFKGKYVVVWKKIGNTWKIYLDIWNRI